MPQFRNKTKFLLLLIVFLLIIPLFLWQYWYRSQSTVTLGQTKWMASNSIEGYTGRFHYEQGDSVTFFIRSESDSSKGVLRQITGPYQYRYLDTFQFGVIKQPLHDKQSTQGCEWEPTFKLHLDESYQSGYYNLHLTNSQDTSNITFLVRNPEEQAKVVILSPVSTWVAYNSWGGKSLYVNGLDSSADNYFVSARRPLTSLNYSRERNRQSIHVEANIFNWFERHYATTLLPDYSMEDHPRCLKKADIIVLAYHCEYFSKPMYDQLENLVYEQCKSLISLGGNQIYNKVQWHEDYSQMECHKDLTFFENWAFGGSWKHNFRSEASFLGVRYSPAGLHTFAPYQAIKPDHWLFSDTKVKKGDLFGEHGINQYPLSGYETDKTTWCSKDDVKVIAQGLNPKKGKPGKKYFSKKDNRGGGMITLKDLSSNNAILATGSIQSGSGLGVDSVFTGIIRNFVERYSTHSQ